MIKTEEESKTLEYKERMTKTYLKTVSAYANYNDGEIVFVVDDDLNVIGLADPRQFCINIKNQINDTIKPIYDVMEYNYVYKRTEIENKSHLNKISVIRALNLLEEKQIAKKIGSGPKVTYVRIK